MSLKDTYKELEQYFEQVNDEIMQVFEDYRSPCNLEKQNRKIDNGLQKSCNYNVSTRDHKIQRVKANPDWCLQHLNYIPDNRVVNNNTSLQSNLISNNSKSSNIKPELHNLQQFYYKQDLMVDYSPIQRKMTVKVNKQSCSQLDRHLVEIEATEACKWLRAAGFPQYAQMYEDMQFPVDIAAAQLDHPLLEPAVLQSLFRRLDILNHCAHVCQLPNCNGEESEDEQCALSQNWIYQSDLKRWSRNHEDNKKSSIKKTPSIKKSCKVDVNNDDNGLSNKCSEKFSINFVENKECKVLRRTTSTRLRHHREGVVVTDIVDSISNNISDILLQRLGNIKHVDEYTLSDTKCIKEEENILPNSDSLDKEISDSNDNNEVSCTQMKDVVKNQQPGRPLISLLCTELQILRKLALLKLTAYIEKYCPTHRTGWNWELPRFIRKIRASTYKENQLLSMPITAVLQKTGQPLPKGIQEALVWLCLNGLDQVGLFRKPGVKSRIQALKVLVESKGGNTDFNDQQAYDVADMVKQYFRELPEALLTNKLSETFILIFQYVPSFLRKEAVLCALLLMPDEHREVLQALLHFLLKIAKHSNINQMNDNNLSICFAPALFQYNSYSCFYKSGINSINSQEVVDIKAAQECLLYMLRNNVFTVPKAFLSQCKLSEANSSVVVQLSELGKTTEGDWQGYMQECHTALLREVREKNRGWVVVSTPYHKIELSYKKVDDGHPLRLWKVCVEIEAPPTEVLHRVLRERHIWDEDLQSAKIIAQMNKNSEVFHYVRRNLSPLPYVDYCIIRTWNIDLPRGTCVIVETSVEHPDIPNIPNSIRGIVLGSRYFIEPGGSGRSRLLHLSRVDMRGRMPEWYHKNFGHLCAIHALNIQCSFHQSAAGPESKV